MKLLLAAATPLIVCGSVAAQEPSLENCLEIASDEERLSCYDTVFDFGGTSDTTSLSQPPDQDTDLKLADYLQRASAEEDKMPSLVEEIAQDEGFSPAPSDERDALENAIVAYVRPLPASKAELNLFAYQALARINPSVSQYKDRIARYEQAIEATKLQLERSARQLEQRLIKTTAEFDGSSWSRHPSSPRYQDTRDYVTLYLLESGGGRKQLELFVNYTSRDGWLFVESAQVNIDGKMERIPITQWYRDNDTEIWEWGSIRGNRAIELAERIANADRAVIRFNGQQFYDDFVVSATDKKVMREMLAMWDVISKD